MSYVTVIPRTHVGYELLNNGRGTDCIIKYQKLDFVYAEVFNVNPCKHRDCILLNISFSKVEFRGGFPYLDKL